MVSGTTSTIVGSMMFLALPLKNLRNSFIMYRHQLCAGYSDAGLPEYKFTLIVSFKT